MRLKKIGIVLFTLYEKKIRHMLHTGKKKSMNIAKVMVSQHMRQNAFELDSGGIKNYRYLDSVLKTLLSELEEALCLQYRKSHLVNNWIGSLWSLDHNDAKYIKSVTAMYSM